MYFMRKRFCMAMFAPLSGDTEAIAVVHGSDWPWRLLNNLYSLILSYFFSLWSR